MFHRGKKNRPYGLSFVRSTALRRVRSKLWQIGLLSVVISAHFEKHLLARSLRLSDRRDTWYPQKPRTFKFNSI